MKLPFDPGLIRVDTPPITIFETMRKIQREHIRLSPEFQRNFVWSEQQQSRLIESILLRVPLPAFYLDASNEDQWQVVDGFQRLTTIYRFCKQQTLRLQGLEFLRHLDNADFSGLSEAEQRILEDTRLTLIVVQPGTPSHVKFVIFQRINTGGTTLNTQEIRHALYEGPARELLRTLAEGELFRAATEGMTDTQRKRMEDRECVLRFLTLKLNPEYVGSHSDSSDLSYEDLLTRTMGDLNQSSPAALDQLQLEFQASMRKAATLFGDLAFRELLDPQEPGPFRKQLFDVWSVLLTEVSFEAVARHRATIVQQALAIMQGDTVFVAALKPESDDWPSVARRFETIRQLLVRIS